MESGVTLDINRLLRERDILPGKHVTGSWTWRNTRTLEETASICYEASLVNTEAAWVRLHYTINGALKDYRTRLEATFCHYGGLRWWWICPASGRRATKLYLPPGATVFAARGAYRFGNKYSAVRILRGVELRLEALICLAVHPLRPLRRGLRGTLVRSAQLVKEPALSVVCPIHWAPALA